jgi:hypothetical protein
VSRVTIPAPFPVYVVVSEIPTPDLAHMTAETMGDACHAAVLPPRRSGEDRREHDVVVFLRDTRTALGVGCKLKGTWVDGGFDDSSWRLGEHRCDCARGRLFYTRGPHPCGRSRFVVERILRWDTGETVYSEIDPASDQVVSGPARLIGS